MFFAGGKNPCSPLSLALMVTAVIGMSGCGEHESVHKYIEDAKVYHQKGDDKTATIQLKNALQIMPDNGEARYLLGIIYSKNGEFQSAEKELRRALELGIEKNRLQVALGQALLNQGQLQKVLDEITPDPGFKSDVLAGILTVRANAYLSLNKTKDAKAALDAALRLQPDYAEAYLGLARLASLGGDQDETLRQINIALEKAPRNVQAWLFKGDVFRLKNKKDESLAAYQQAKKIDPKNIAAHLALASAYLAENRVNEARKEADAARKIMPNNLFATYLTALMDFREAKYVKAQEQLQQVLRSEPNHMPSVLLSGAVNYVLGNYAQAEADLNKFLSQSSGNLYARKLLAATLLKTEQPERALTVLKPALTGKTQDLQLLVLAGEVYIAMKEYDQSTEYLLKAAAIEPNSATLRTQLGVSQLGKGDTNQAVAEFEYAAALDPTHDKADTLLILTYLGKKDYDKALQATRALEKKLPNDAALFNFRGEAYLGKGDVVNARKSFEKALALQPTYLAPASRLAELDTKDKHPELARKRFEGILEKDKNNLPAILALAKMAAINGQEKEYVGWLDRATKANPSALQPLSLLSRYYVGKKQMEKALVLAHEAQTAHPNSAEALDLLGAVQFAAGEKENALSSYTQLTLLTPKSPLAYLKLASAQVKMQKIEAGKVSLKKALEIKPDYFDAQAALMMLQANAGKYHEALDIARRIQIQSPRSPTGFVMEGDVLMVQKSFGPAEIAYAKAFGLNKNPALLIKLSQATRFAGDVKKADADVARWLTDHPEDIEVRMYLAGAYMREGQNKYAIEQYQLALKQTSSNIVALNNLAELYQQTNDPRALPTAEQAYKLRPDSPAIMDTLGWIHFQLGNLDAAVDLSGKASILPAATPEIHYHFAVALAKAGKKSQARKELEAILASKDYFSQRPAAQSLLDQLK